MNADDIVVAVIALWGGELVGRTRLQKGAYLLHRCGADFDLPFVYYHYGPYSFDLAAGCADAHEERRIEIEERPGRHGVRYAIFTTPERASHIGALSRGKALDVVKKMKPCTDVVLELAATVVFLRDEGGYPNNAVAETRERKSVKSGNGRLEAALSLIRNLGLDPENALEIPA